MTNLNTNEKSGKLDSVDYLENLENFLTLYTDNSFDQNNNKICNNNCKFDYVVNEIDSFSKIKDFYDILHNHAKKCFLIISRYNIKRKEISKIEEKLKKSIVLEDMDSKCSQNNSTPGFENSEISYPNFKKLNNKKLNKKILKFENLLAKVQEISYENLKLTIMMNKEIVYIKEIKRLILQAISLSEKMKLYSNLNSYNQSPNSEYFHSDSSVSEFSISDNSQDILIFETTSEISLENKISKIKIDCDKNCRVFDKIKTLFKNDKNNHERKSSSLYEKECEDKTNNNLQLKMPQTNLISLLKVGMQIYPIIKMTNLITC